MYGETQNSGLLLAVAIDDVASAIKIIKCNQLLTIYDIYYSFNVKCLALLPSPLERCGVLDQKVLRVICFDFQSSQLTNKYYFYNIYINM